MRESGLRNSALIQLGPTRASQMLAAYCANIDRGAVQVRGMILEDIHRFSELGAKTYANDLRQALHMFDEKLFSPAFPRPWGELGPMAH